ncbi:Heat shock transcription factor hsf-1 [Caenorhabditis elegans]|uniref:Heat shock transcription factor hsf-1 n=1 Tax=Caenorhabditis elegans TaxID=6239 RepID=HSF1_CAEEL|nr:Heat shock transcription factor hsf-1 [Caenorhabditis elegans]G5EFT5.1 RecName: Full=Heat shock transcription factor hsf-1 [Caenorhabditis elegans]AAS72409.1 heat shock transcription factor 1 [Caenorhabditis elegans]CAA22146.1 Heat shock transcription factor hsf-1 [Caenorhabditis elegans]|eukprot:NP_493031.1 Heat Shock Factor [Caenorhabditis elegans]
MQPTGNQIQQNQQQQQQLIMRVPKQEVSVSGAARRYVQQAPPNRPPRQNHQNGAIGGKKSSVTIQEVPNNAYLETLNKSGNNKVDDDKLPVFLIKLWNIVEDPNLQSIVHWDDSGASFHISDPYLFGRNVLPHFFKHNNMNSMVRQLNMYGFRKMTPLSQGGLTRTESDQDHLEFSHPCFVQGRPELLSQIKRKQSARTVEDKQVNEQTQQNLEVVMAEMRAMREKAKNMEDKMNKLTKENRDMWTQMGSMRQQHARQQQYFKKLLHFLVSVMQPGLSKRVAKRGVLEIDFCAANGTAGPNSKRARMNSEEGPYKDVCDLLESLQRETQEPFSRRFTNNEGPLISEVTDEFGNSPVGRGSAQDLFGDTFGAQSSRYSDGGATSSREQSPHPIISQPQSNSAGAHGANEQKPDDMYMGSGPLTHENIHRGISALKRDYQGASPASGGPSTSSSAPSGAGAGARMAQKRAAPYKNATRQMAQPQQDYSGGFVNNYSGFMPSDPSMIPYQPSHQYLQPHQKLMAIEDQHHPTTSTSSTNADPHQNLYSPTLGLSPSFDRQLSQELQEYFTGTDTSLESFRDLVSNHNWDDFGNNVPLDDDEEGSEDPLRQLALENAPETSNYDGAEDLLFDNEQQYPENGFDVPDPNYLPLADEEIFPHSPALRTPSPSDPNLV